MKTTHEPEVTEAAPTDLDAERCLLGSLACAPEMLDDVRELIDETAFADERNAAIFRAMAALPEDQRGGVLFVADWLGRAGELATAGGPAHIVDCFESVPHGSHARHYGHLVREAFERRAVLFAARDVAKAILDKNRTVEEVAAEFGKRADAILDRQRARAVVTGGEAVQRYFAKLEEGRQNGPLTGLPDLDEKIGSLPRAGMPIVAARPGIGKTSFASCVAVNVAKTGTPVLFHSLEQPSEELAERFLCDLSGISAHELRKFGTADADTRDRFTWEAERLGPLPLYVDDRAGRTATEIISATKAAHRRYGARLVIVDYLQLVVSDDRRAVREQQVSAMSRAFRALARDLDICVMVLAQLNRQSEQRPGKRPALADLRESGAIEQDADMVLLLHRPAVHDESANHREAAVIVAKNRGGPTGSVPLEWAGELMTFRTVTPAAPSAPYFDDEQERR